MNIDELKTVCMALESASTPTKIKETFADWELDELAALFLHVGMMLAHYRGEDGRDAITMVAEGLAASMAFTDNGLTLRDLNLGVPRLRHLRVPVHCMP